MKTETRTPPLLRPTSSLASIVGLQGITLFQGLPREVLEAIAQRCRWCRYGPGQRILSREAPDNDVYFVVAGRVQVTAFSASGRQVTYGDMGAADCFGDFAALDGLSRSADVVAVEETLVAAMESAAFKRLLHDQPDVCDRLLRRLVGCIRALTERVFDFSTLGVQNRVHAELLRLAKGAGVKDNIARIDPAPKHADIAGQISTYREQVTRELSAMAKQGLVRRAGKALVVQDVVRLQQLVAEVRQAP